MHALKLLQYSFTRKWYIFISIMDGHTLDTLPSKAVMDIINMLHVGRTNSRDGEDNLILAQLQKNLN